jgi:Ser/Thr protein kinase RdoA (MazF antagonist)
MTVAGSFIIRRLAPDGRKAELGDDPHAQLKDTLLEAMGREIGSLHAATADVEAVQANLTRRGSDWLYLASEKAAQAVEDDFKSWAGGHRGRRSTR